MANSLFNKGREAFMSGGINMSSDTIKVVLIDAADYVVNLATHQYFSSVTAAGRVATATLASKTVTDGIFDAGDVTFTSVTGDPSEALLIYKDTGTEATSPLIAYIDTARRLRFPKES